MTPDIKGIEVQDETATGTIQPSLTSTTAGSTPVEQLPVAQKRVQPHVANDQQAEVRLAVKNWMAGYLDLPYAATGRGIVAGGRWAKDVEEIIGPDLWQKVRAILTGWHTDRANIAFLAAIHFCCFGTKMATRNKKKFCAEYRRGFLIGVLRGWDGKKGKL